VGSGDLMTRRYQIEWTIPGIDWTREESGGYNTRLGARFGSLAWTYPARTRIIDTLAAHDWYAPKILWATKHADEWARDHCDHADGSDAAIVWHKSFWADQQRRIDNVSATVICGFILAVAALMGVMGA